MFDFWFFAYTGDENDGIEFEETDYFILALFVFIAVLCRWMIQNL